MVLLLLLVLSIASISNGDTVDRELRFVQIITRHGARAAFNEIPNNGATWNCHLQQLSVSASDLKTQYSPVLYRKRYIPGRQHLKGDCAQGELTVEGWRNHLMLGANLRSRYIDDLHFLPAQLNTSLLYVRSTDSPRTIASVQANLLGLYPVSSRPGNPLVDIYSIETMNEDLLPSTDCPLLMNSCNRVQQTQEWKNKLNGMEAMGRKLKAAWNTTKLPEWLEIFDNLYSRTFHEIPLPPGVTFQMYREIEDFAVWQLKELYRAHEVKTLGIGRFVSELVEAIDRAAQHGPKYVHYSAHDITISLLLSVYNQLDTITSWPRYASSIQLELYYEHKAKDYVVQMMYNLQPLVLSECSNTTFCPWQKFREISLKSVSADYAGRCNSQTPLNIPTDLISKFMC